MPAPPERWTDVTATRASLTWLYLEDVDAVFERALKAGAKAQRPVADQFYGDRSGTLEDPYGHVWTVATHVEDVPPEEMQRRAAAAMKSSPNPEARPL